VETRTILFLYIRDLWNTRINTNIYKPLLHYFYMKQYKQLRFRLSSWNHLRKAYYGRKDENFSDYVDRVAETILRLKEIEHDLVIKPAQELKK